MKENIFGKGLIIGLICILIVPSITVATAENNSDYNLKIKIKNTTLLCNSSFCRLSVNVSNEGPEVSDNYSIRVYYYCLFARFFFPPWRSYGPLYYTGLPIAPNGYEKTLVTIYPLTYGWYFVRALLYSEDDNPEGNTFYCLFWRPL